jgi:hypothetical protein
VRRSLTTGPLPCGALLILALGSFGTLAEAGPYVTHRIADGSTPTASKAAEAQRNSKTGLPSWTSPPLPLRTSDGGTGSVRVSLSDLGYPAVAAGAVVDSDPIRPNLPRRGGSFETGLPNAVESPERPAPSDRPWLVAAKPARLRYASPLGLSAKRTIPEPTSILLLLTGFIGLATRRRLLRARS